MTEQSQEVENRSTIDLTLMPHFELTRRAYGDGAVENEMFVLLGHSVVVASCETGLQNGEIHLPSTNRKLCEQQLQSTKLLSRLMVKVIVVKMDFV